MWKKLFQSIREYKKATLLAPAYVTLEVIIECFIPFITALLVNQIKAGCTFDVVLHYGLILIALASMSLTFGWLSGRAAAAASGFARNLRKDLFYKIQSFSFENIDRFSSSSLVTRLTTDVSNVQNAFMMLIRVAIRSPLMLIFAVVMSFIMGGRLALIFVVVIPILALGLFFIIRKAFPIFRRVFRKYDALNRSIQENVQGIRVVKSFVREEHEKQKFGAAAEDLREEFTKAEKILAFNSPMMQFCLYVNMIFILTFGAYTIASGGGASGFNVGQLSSLMIYSFQTLMSLMMLSMVFVMVTIADESGRRIVEVLDEQSTLASPERAVQAVADGSVDFDRVSFRYSEKAERLALQDIDLHIRSGEFIGILGTTGSSKTSLVQLIPRLYDATTGTVSVGGRNVKDYDLGALRDSVSVVLQSNLLFSGTIAENLRWGNPEATDEEIRHACVLAQADDFIRSFPQGYETRMEQGGTNVSGGQKQRLCIARALLKKPRILILDDSTSAVDTHTDAKIRQALKEFLPETTKIIIAQRVASVMDADRIVLMDKGGIQAIGTHEQLLDADASYREVYASQNKAGEEE